MGEHNLAASDEGPPLGEEACTPAETGMDAGLWRVKRAGISICVVPSPWRHWIQSSTARPVERNHQSVQQNRQMVQRDHPTVRRNHPTVRRNHSTVQRNHPTVQRGHWTAQRDHRQGQFPAHRQQSRFQDARRESRDFFAELPARFRLNPSSNLKVMQYDLQREWKEYGFGEPMLDALKSMDLVAPNAMQCNVMPALLREKSKVLCAAETGSGKTLAYLLPIIHKLKVEETLGPGVREEARPRAVILVPSNELVNQVYAVAKLLSHHVKLRVERLSGALQATVRERNSRGAVDMIIGTPLQLRFALDDGLLSYDRVKHVVIDEADSLLSDDFGQQIKDLLKTFAPDLETMAIASATIPYSLTTQLADVLPTITRLGSPKLHMPSERIDIRFIEIDKPGNARFGTPPCMPRIDLLLSQTCSRSCCFDTCHDRPWSSATRPRGRHWCIAN